jgi:hypothetical protein
MRTYAGGMGCGDRAVRCCVCWGAKGVWRLPLWLRAAGRGGSAGGGVHFVR